MYEHVVGDGEDMAVHVHCGRHHHLQTHRQFSSQPETDLCAPDDGVMMSHFMLLILILLQKTLIRQNVFDESVKRNAENNK